MARQERRTLADPTAGEIRFFTLVRSRAGCRHARLLIESLRAFGGSLSRCPVWVFLPDPGGVQEASFGTGDVHLVHLDVPEALRGVFFGDKVCACAQAEALASGRTRSLVWLNPQCLILNPPILLDLGSSFDAAFRPVHVQNVGLTAQEPLDDFWGEIYRQVGLEDTPFVVESFLGAQRLRPYWNTHLFAIDPSLGVLGLWLGTFRAMAADRGFMSGPCADVDHQVFLHQAILSALLTKRLERERMRVLPPEYSYPLHFHHRVPPSLRPRTLNSQVCPVYEEAFRYPDTLNGLEVLEPLRSWLLAAASGNGGDISTAEQ